MFLRENLTASTSSFKTFVSLSDNLSEKCRTSQQKDDEDKDLGRETTTVLVPSKIYSDTVYHPMEWLEDTSL